MNFFVYDDLQNYAVSTLEERRRRETRRSLERFSARRMLDPGEFARTAYPVYLEFYQRTGYPYRKRQRLDQTGFARWSDALFAQPAVLVLGVFRRGRLEAVDISFRLGAIIFDDTFFSNNASLRHHVTNFTVHTLRKYAALTDALWLCRGGPSNKPGLDAAKLRRGCRLICLPARYHANPLALGLLQVCCKSQYRRLLGLDLPQERSGPRMMRPHSGSDVPSLL
jgi:hypothetical protein